MRPGLRVIGIIRLLAISNLPNLLITQPCILDRGGSYMIHKTVLTALFILVIFTNLRHGTPSPIPA
jgi:hypothetical protein